MKKQIMSIALLSVLFLTSMNEGWSKDTTLEGSININTASPQELMLLPGVGEAKAKLIMDTRSGKPFASRQDLLAIKGIGEKTLALWEGHVVFQGNTTLKEVPAKNAGTSASASAVKAN